MQVDSQLTAGERKRLQTRRAIVAAAQQLFYERGFENTTVADIAEAADVALQTVFNHVRTKEELFFAGRTPFAPANALGPTPPDHVRTALVDALVCAAADYVSSLDNLVTRNMAFQIEAVPALNRYERTLFTHVESAVADYLALTGGVPRPRWTAALLLTTTRVSTHDGRRDVIGGSSVTATQRQLRVRLRDRLGRIMDATTTLAGAPS